MRRVIILALILGAMLAVQLVHPQTAFACSGVPETLDSLIGEADYLIKARIERSDDVGQNHIVRVESYITGGSGPEYLLLSQRERAVIQGLRGGTLGHGDCNFYATRPPTENAFYVFVRRTDVGFMSQFGALFSSDLYVFDESGQPANRVNFYDREGRYHAPTEAEFLSLVADYSSEIPSVPIEDTPYPRTSSLLIVTDDQNYFIAPVDGSAPIAIDEERVAQHLIGRFDIATNLRGVTGSLVGHYGSCFGRSCSLQLLDDMTTVRLAYDGDAGTILSPYDFPVADGHSALFANDRLSAIWNGDRLIFYSLQFQPSAPYSVHQLHEIQLNGGESVRGASFSAWSPDGTRFAYSDSSGLWLIETHDIRHPQLLVESENDSIPYATGFSPSGRFLHINASTNYTVDLQNEAILPYGTFSEDERFLLFTDSANGVQNLYLSDYEHDTSTLVQQNALEFNWLNDRQFLTAVCHGNRHESCVTHRWHIQEHDNQITLVLNADATQTGHYFRVSTDGDIALIQNDNTVSINGELFTLPTTGRIYTIRWLPSFFYHAVGN